MKGKKTLMRIIKGMLIATLIVFAPMCIIDQIESSTAFLDETGLKSTDELMIDASDRLKDGDDGSINFPYRVKALEVVAGGWIFEESILLLSVKGLEPIKMRLVNRYLKYKFPNGEIKSFTCALENYCAVQYGRINP